MDVVDAQAQAVIKVARREVRHELGWTVVLLALCAFTVAVSVSGTVPAPWGWLLAGFIACEVAAGARKLVQVLREARQVARCSTCRTAAVETGAALRDWRMCVRAKHAASGGVS